MKRLLFIALGIICYHVVTFAQEVKVEEIANKPATNPLSSLQGKVAGVQIVNSGRAGADPEIGRAHV